MVSVDDDVCAEGWRRRAGDSAGAGGQVAASLESVSISVVEDEEWLDCDCVVSCPNSCGGGGGGGGGAAVLWQAVRKKRRV